MDRMAANNSSGGLGAESAPSAHLGDLVEGGVLLALFLLGAPLNLVAFFHLNGHHGTGAPPSDPIRGVSRDMLTLQRHLNFSDLLVIFIYVVSEICWLLTYSWRGGAILCKLVMLLRVLAFQSSSLIVVAVALNRLFAVLRPSSDPEKRASALVAAVWILSLLLSLPQLLVWRLMPHPFPGHPAWAQCSTQWEIAAVTGDRVWLPFSAATYTILHLLAVFWLPLAVIAASYALLLCRIHSAILLVRKRTSKRRVGRRGREGGEGGRSRR